MISSKLNELEMILKELSSYERQGLDTSYLKHFIKQYKIFISLNKAKPDISNYSDSERFAFIKEIMNDKNIFPTIASIINFANDIMNLDFKPQKESRETTIRRILKRVEKDSEFREKIKKSLLLLLNDPRHFPSQKTVSYTKKIDNSIELDKWVRMLKDL